VVAVRLASYRLRIARPITTARTIQTPRRGYKREKRQQETSGETDGGRICGMRATSAASGQSMIRTPVAS
jgi:hypothetical protein